MKNVGICLRPQGYQRPPDVVRSRSYDPAHEPPGGPDGDGEARGRGIAADRGGGRLVRVSRGDPQPVGDPLPRARAVGLGPPDAADAGDQDPARKAPPSRGGVGATWSRGAASSPSRPAIAFAIASSGNPFPASTRTTSVARTYGIVTSSGTGPVTTATIGTRARRAAFRARSSSSIGARPST